MADEKLPTYQYQEQMANEYYSSHPDHAPKGDEAFMALDPKERQQLHWDTPIASSKDPSAHEGTPNELFNHVDSMLADSQADIDAAHQKFLDAIAGAQKRGMNIQAIGAEDVSPAGRIRIRKDLPAAQEYLKRLPDDVEAFDLKDGTMIFRKKPHGGIPTSAEPYKTSDALKGLDPKDVIATRNAQMFYPVLKDQKAIDAFEDAVANMPVSSNVEWRGGDTKTGKVDVDFANEEVIRDFSKDMKIPMIKGKELEKLLKTIKRVK